MEEFIVKLYSEVKYFTTRRLSLVLIYVYFEERSKQRIFI